jgi:5-methylcytosine-specific restriction enzyme B
LPITTNNNFDRLVEYLQGNLASLGHDPSQTDQYKKFIAAFPASKLLSITLDQYCVGKQTESFCWWIERGLEDVLGRYMPGSARGHILYFQKDGSVYKHRALLDLSDLDALSYTLKIQSAIANADPNSDLTWIDDDAQLYQRAGVQPLVTIGEGRKLRLLSCYNPEIFLPISSSEHVGHFLETLGCPAAEIPNRKNPLARTLLLRQYWEAARAKIAKLSPWDFMNALYRSDLGLAPVKEAESDDKDVLDNVMQAVPTTATQCPPLNQILFGPPGTGKTYATIEAALEVLAPEFLLASLKNRAALKARFDEYVAGGHIRFVTFHQSFSYEDFVEGLRAESDEAGQLRYEIVDGLFKRLCDAAAAKVTQQETAPLDLSGRKIWKMSLGNSLGNDAYLFEECTEQGYALLGYGSQLDFSACGTRQQIRDLLVKNSLVIDNDSYEVTAVNAFVNKMTKGDLVVVTEGNLKFRAIGEITGDYRVISRDEQGDTYSQCRSVKWLRVYKPSLPYDQLMNNKFSQMTIYELKHGAIDMDKLAGLLQAKAPSPATPFVVGEKFGSGYEVVKATADLLELKKPSEKSLPLGMSLLQTLADYVEKRQLTLEDIGEKKVFKKVPTTKLEPHLVNGYNNILPHLVARLLNPNSGVVSSQPDRKSIDAKVLIIDEINRGNVSRIFGELITLIEPSKRAGQPEALEAMLPYSKERFSVPSNLYLIGTMNTADRSLAGLDIAMRRRFTFREMPPKPDLLNAVEIQGVNIGQLLRVMNERIEVLLDRDHCLGHAYFMTLAEQGGIEELAAIFKTNVIPLLQEYFFEDWQRIQWVLNDHRKPKIDRFVLKQNLDTVALFGAGVAVNEQGGLWKINEDAFKRIEAYQSITSVPQGDGGE